MLLLEVTNLKKYYADRLVVELPAFQIWQGDRIGIVGRNGAGKSTLLGLLSGEIAPDEGSVRRLCPLSVLRQLEEGEQGSSDPRLLGEFGVKGKEEQETLSGGERTRRKLAAALSPDAPLLMLDEPTSDLDEEGQQRLRQKIAACETVVLISHDRDLLRRECTRIVEVEQGTVTVFECGYDDYREEKRRREDYRQFRYERYDSERKRLSGAVENANHRAGKIKKAPSRMGNSEARLHKREAGERRAKIEQEATAIKTRIELLEKVEKPREAPEVKIDFSLTDPPRNKIVLSADHLTFSYGGTPLFRDASFEVYGGSKTALMGANGAGKTTLLRLIAEGDEGIYTVPKAKVGYFRQDLMGIDPKKSVVQNAMADSVQSETTARTILSRLLFSREEVQKPAGVLSGGERVKLQFAKLFVSAANVLLLDEPTNYLDVESLEALEEMIRRYEGTVLFVSHDREFVKACADRLLVLEDGTISVQDAQAYFAKTGGPEE